MRSNIASQAEVLHRLPAVRLITGRSRAWLYRAVAAGEFPKPVQLGLRAVAWRDSDLKRWQDGLAVGSRSAGSGK